MELRDVLRRLKAAQGIRRIHEETGVHRTIIRALRETAEAQGCQRPRSSLRNERKLPNCCSWGFPEEGREIGHGVLCVRRTVPDPHINTVLILDSSEKDYNPSELWDWWLKPSALGAVPGLRESRLLCGAMAVITSTTS